MRRDLVTLKAAGSETASTVGTAVELDGGVLNLQLAITAITGAGATLTLVVQGSQDNVTWYTLYTFPGQTATTTGVFQTVAAPQYVRYSSTMSGTVTTLNYSLVGNAR